MSRQDAVPWNSQPRVNSYSHKNDQDFKTMAVGELLELDPRPTFVLNIDIDFDHAWEPVFLNAPLRADLHLLRALPFKAKHASTQPPAKIPGNELTSWLRDIASEQTKRPSSSLWFAEVFWTCFVIRNRWILVSVHRGHVQPSESPATRSENITNSLSEQRSEPYRESQPRPKQALTSPNDNNILLSPNARISPPAFVTPGTPDWTVAHPSGDLSNHVKFARSFDWATTPLGDMTTWSREFRQIACLLMANPHPAALFWGDELTVMYNQAYAETVAGLKHPRLMGTGFRGPFSEIWDDVGFIFNECRRTGRSVGVENQMLPMERFGFTEETFYTWSLTPLYGGTDQLLGLYNAPFETTHQTRSKRALNTLLKLAQETALANSVSAFWSKIIKGLEDNIYDFPFLMLYSVGEECSETDESTSQCSEISQSFRCCILEGTLGVPEGHPAAPARLDLNRSRGGFVPAFREALKSREPKFLCTKDGTLSESMMEGFEFRGFPEPSREAVVCPIRPTTGDIVMGFLVFGINPRRRYDDEYQSFVKLLDRELATSMASVSLLESEIRRGLTAAQIADQEKSRLSEELAAQRSHLQRIAEVSPVGLFSMDPNGSILEANEKFFHMTGHPRDLVMTTLWQGTIHEESELIVATGWKMVTEERLPWTAELRLNQPAYDQVTGKEIDNWIIANLQPEIWDGKLKSVMGSITDITLPKRSAKEAETRAILSEQLLQQTEEAERFERKFKRFSDLAPGGLVIMNAQAEISYANSQWYSISGHTSASNQSDTAASWTDAILLDDQDFFREKWAEMQTQKSTITFELRMCTSWEGDIGGSFVTIPRWILASMYPEVDENGELLSVMGCITDISRIKWAENLQTRRLEEAEETRRAQNNFIDITSHEMRNPLSAILQCADGISTSLHEVLPKMGLDPVLNAIMMECISSAETIQLCAQHQKSIVDDILTISKLDSNLLVISPVPIQPVEIVRQALQMFLVECQKVHGITMTFHIGPSFQELNIDMVMLDSSRLLQVLINLLTNAIKFTKSASKKTIDVSISAYLDPPVETNKNFEYFPTKRERIDVTPPSEWGAGQIIYLRFEVQDSGCGLKVEEKKRLFNRFSQASPRTHVQYGGSGLGLFISRQLTELQGGEIGVASEAGVGSTFAFYVKSRRVLEPRHGHKHLTTSSSDLQANAQVDNASPQGAMVQEAKFKTLGQVNGPDSPRSYSPNSLSDPKNWHILIVEDNLVNQKILAQQIRKLGCTVHVANHGEEALELIQKSRYFKGREDDGIELSVVLMDLEMPVMDGLTCVKRIREWEEKGLLGGRRTPIIAVTANARGEQVANARNSGMDDVMPKPFRILQIRSKIDTLLNRMQHANSAFPN